MISTKICKHVKHLVISEVAKFQIFLFVLLSFQSWFNPHGTHVVFSRRHNEEPPVSPSNNSVEHSVVAARTHARRSLGGGLEFLLLLP